MPILSKVPSHRWRTGGAVLGLVLGVMFPGSAQALSCMKPSIETSLETIAGAEQTYVILRGRFRQIEPEKWHQPDAPGAPEVPLLAKARFTGMALDDTSFLTPVDQPVRIEVSCAGPWCGGLPDDDLMIYFMRLDPGRGLVLERSPCGGMSFPAQQENRLRALLSGF